MNEFIHGAQLGIWDRETCARLHDATLTVLETTGVEVHHEGALKLLADAGARVEGTRVRIAAGMVADAFGICAAVLRAQVARRRGSHADGRRSHVLRHRLRLSLRARPRQPREASRARGRYSGHGGDHRTAAQRRLRHVDGSARRRSPGGRRPRPVRRHAARHTQAAAALRPRRPHPLGNAGDGGGLRRGAELRHLRHASATPLARGRGSRQARRLRRARHPGRVRLGAGGRRHGADVPGGRGAERQRRDAERARDPPARQPGSALHLRCRPRRVEPAHQRGALLRPRGLRGPARRLRTRAALRPALLHARRFLGLKAARRPVGRRGGTHPDARGSLASDTRARPRLPRVRPAERLRGGRVQRRARRLRAQLRCRGARRRGVAGLGGDRGRRTRRLIPLPAPHAPARPRLLARVVARPVAPWPLAERGRRGSVQRLRVKVGELRAAEAPFRLPDEADRTIEQALAAAAASRAG